MSRAGMLLLLAVSWIAPAGSASAPGRSDCRSPQPPSIGAAFGHSLPSVELSSSVAPAEPNSSVSARSGAQVAGRADLPVIGPLRVRLEGATARWEVRRIRYDPNGGFRVIDEELIGQITTRHLVALVGPGLYSIGYQGTSGRRAGFAIAAGMEIPTGSRGAVQLDVTVHLIGTSETHRLRARPR